MITVRGRKDAKELAKAILGQILNKWAIQNESKFLDAFETYWVKRGAFTLRNDAPELVPYIVEFKERPDQAFNEGYMKFDDSAYKNTYGRLSPDWRGYAQFKERVTSDLIDVFNEVAEREMTKQDRLVGRQVPAEEMPGLSYIKETQEDGKRKRIKVNKVEVGVLSQCAIPSVQVNADGTLIVSDQFFSILMKLHELGLRFESRGGIYDSTLIGKPGWEEGEDYISSGNF